MNREKISGGKKKGSRMFKNCETIVKKCNVFTMRIPEEKGAEKRAKGIMAESIPKFMTGNKL